MKTTIHSSFFFTIIIFMLSCKKNVETEKIKISEKISQEAKLKLKKLGYDPEYVLKYPEGYIVEGDILLTEEDLKNEIKQDTSISIAKRYVKGWIDYSSSPKAPPTRYSIKSGTYGINFSFGSSPELSSNYKSAVFEAIRRFNDLNTGLKFTTLNLPPKGNIVIRTYEANDNVWAYAGYPLNGTPYETIYLNTTTLGSSPNINFLATIITHELGHCIGFRHTDYTNRAFSGCFVDASNPANEGGSATHVPGTPTGPEEGSWMLACIGEGVNRPFNANDIIALKYLFPK